MNHETIEKNSALMTILIFFLVSIGGIVQIVPLFYLDSAVKKVEGIRPYTMLELEGRDIFIREGCHNCHSQMIRPFRDEYERYGHYSIAAESMYDHPFQWGTKRTGPDLARIGGLYSNEWHRVHLEDPRSVVPESVMPAYPWLITTKLNTKSTKKKIEALTKLGVPYNEELLDFKELNEKTEVDALIAYLQVLGTFVKFEKY